MGMAGMVAPGVWGIKVGSLTGWACMSICLWAGLISRYTGDEQGRLERGVTLVCWWPN